MSGKHTPGPWFLEGNWDATNGKNLAGWLSCFPPSGSVLFELVPIGGGDEEIVANARLMAAAPDMLPLVRLLASIPIDDKKPDDQPVFARNEVYILNRHVRAARAALAKAEGGAA